MWHWQRIIPRILAPRRPLGLDTLACRLAASLVYRHLLYLSATCLTVLFVGYHFGTFDQAVHIPFLKKYADLALYPGDAFLDLRLQHFSYFWFFFLPFYRLGVLEVTIFVVHFAATYGTFWALWRLGDTLFGDPLANLIGLAAFAFIHLGFSAFPVIEFSLLNRTFVLPWLLVALTLYLRRRYWLAFCLLGLMYNLHALSVHFVLAMFALDIVLEWRQVGWRSLLGGLAAFLIAALPVLIWRRNDGPIDLALRPEWLSVISRSMFYHLFYFVAPFPHIAIVTLSGLCTLLLFAVSRCVGPPQAHDRTMTIFIAAVLLILVTQAIVTYWLPITAIIQFQIVRAGSFMLIFGYLYFARYLARAWRTGGWGRGDWAALTGMFAFAAFSFMPLMVLALRQAFRSSRGQRAITLGMSPLMILGTVAIGLQYGLWHPGVYIYPRQTTWYQAQLWARENTPIDAVFIVPPHEWWLYESDWRVFSERPALVTHAELLEAAFAPDYLDHWLPRFEAVAPGALPRFRGNIYENLRVAGEAYGGLTPADFQHIAHQYGASFVVVEKPHPCGFQMVYENEQFVICDLRLGGLPWAARSLSPSSLPSCSPSCSSGRPY